MKYVKEDLLCPQGLIYCTPVPHAPPKSKPKWKKRRIQSRIVCFSHVFMKSEDLYTRSVTNPPNPFYTITLRQAD